MCSNTPAHHDYISEEAACRLQSYGMAASGFGSFRELFTMDCRALHVSPLRSRNFRPRTACVGPQSKYTVVYGTVLYVSCLFLLE